MYISVLCRCGSVDNWILVWLLEPTSRYRVGAVATLGLVARLDAYQRAYESFRAYYWYTEWSHCTAPIGRCGPKEPTYIIHDDVTYILANNAFTAPFL